MLAEVKSLSQVANYMFIYHHGVCSAHVIYHWYKVLHCGRVVIGSYSPAEHKMGSENPQLCNENAFSYEPFQWHSVSIASTKYL